MRGNWRIDERHIVHYQGQCGRYKGFNMRQLGFVK